MDKLFRDLWAIHSSTTFVWLSLLASGIFVFVSHDALQAVGCIQLVFSSFVQFSSLKVSGSNQISKKRGSNLINSMY